MAVDREDVRRANRLEDVVPAVTGQQLSRPNGRTEPTIKCPWHDDQHPSLRINLDKQVWRCDPCSIGGDVFSFVERYHRTDFADALQWLADRAGLEPGVMPRVVATFKYVDLDGRERYQKRRIEPGPAGRKKTFSLWRPDGRGGYISGLDGVTPILYRLPDLKDKEAIIVVEGEAKADRLWKLGLPATCAFTKKWTDADTAMLCKMGAQRVVVLPDHDVVGSEHGAQVARSCHAAALKVRIVDLPGLPVKGDIIDWLDAGHTREDLLGLIGQAQPFQPDTTGPAMTTQETTPASSVTPQWPVPLGDAAYHGVFGEIVRAIEPQTEADPAGILVQMLVMFGSMVGRSVHFRVGADMHHLNIFAGIVGQSAKGRKGVSRGQAQRIFEPVDPEWARACITGGLSSGEGLIWAVRDAIERKQPIKERGRVTEYQTVIEDHGVSDKRLLVVETELAGTLKVMAREGNTLSPIVRQAWDGHDLRTLTKTNTAVATSPHISIIGHITRDELRRYLEATETANGFGNRFLWICVKRSKELPDGGDLVDLSGYAFRLKGVQDFLQREGGRELRRDPAANKLWHRVYGRLSAGQPGMFGAMTGRAEAQVMRLACLYAVADRAMLVDQEHLLAALEVWRYASDSAAFLFGDRLGDPTADDILAALKDRAPDGLNRSDISRTVLQRNRSSAEVDRALTLLLDCRLARYEPDRSGGGRPAERWFYVPTVYDINDKTPDVEAKGAGNVVNVVNVVAAEASARNIGAAVEEVEL